MRRTRIIRLTAATIVAVLLPSVSVGATGAAVVLLGLTDAVPYAGAVEDLSSRSMAYWFLALAAIAIASWTWIVKWLISQLDSQRAANTATTEKLISYMEKDHADMREIMGRTTEVLDRVLQQKVP